MSYQGHVFKGSNPILIQQDYEAAKAEVKTWPKDFPSYIDMMIDRSGLKRTQIAQRAGISKDYAYKLFRGDKKTVERDYIVAICMALGMDYYHTQYALEIYPFPVLDEADPRSNVIIHAINNRISIPTLDEWLEAQNFPGLRVSPDRPHAPTGIVSATRFDKEGNGSGIMNDVLVSREKHQYEEVAVEVKAQHCGMAPMDFEYFGEIKLCDEENNTVFVQVMFMSDGGSQYSASLSSMFDPNEDVSADEMNIEFLESYGELEEAGESPFFKYYLKLEKLTDDKAREILLRIDDTRNYGHRIGAHLARSGFEIYIEYFNEAQPEYREYLQVIKRGEEYIYSASHESCFMRIELEELYAPYFGDKGEIEFYIQTNSIDAIDPKYEYFFNAFKQMARILDSELDSLKNPKSQH